MMQTNEITPVVHVKDGQVFANSRDVAEFFGKRHDHLLEKIGLIFSRTPDRASPNFRACLVEHPAVPGRLDRTYDMTKDGFTFLVMGFTGAKADELKRWVRKEVLSAIRKDGGRAYGQLFLPISSTRSSCSARYSSPYPSP